MTIWGNVIDKRLQYRFMVAEGIEKEAINPEDNLRYAGRISWAFWEPETGWFNQGTYLGKKRVLTVGVGMDFQEDLRYGTKKEDYSAWTVDLLVDTPTGPGGAVTLEASYVNLQNGPNALNYTYLTRGDDADIFSLKAGYLLPMSIFDFGKLQPFVHYERIDVDDKKATDIYGFGFNFFIKGHANKLSFDLTYLEQEEESHGTRPVQDHLIATFQVAIGF